MNVWTKEDLERLTGVYWTDYQVQSLNTMLRAHREGKKLYISYPRQGKRMIIQTYDMITAAENKKDILRGRGNGHIIFDEFITENEDYELKLWDEIPETLKASCIVKEER